MQTTDYLSRGGERFIVVNIFGSDLLRLKVTRDSVSVMRIPY